MAGLAHGPASRRAIHRGPGSRMAAVAGLVIAVAAVALAPLGPAATQVQAQDENPILEYLQALAAVEGKSVTQTGDTVRVEDPAGDQEGLAHGLNDILEAGHAWGSMLPSYLLEGPLECGQDNVGCSRFGSVAAAFDMGFAVGHVRLADSLDSLDPARQVEGGILAALEGGVRGFAFATGASIAGSH